MKFKIGKFFFQMILMVLDELILNHIYKWEAAQQL